MVIWDWLALNQLSDNFSSLQWLYKIRHNWELDVQERKAGKLQSRTEYSFYKPPSVQHCQCIFIRLQTLHYPSSAESPPENRLSVMSNWVLKAAGFCGWSIRFSKTKLESSSFITGNETHFWTMVFSHGINHTTPFLPFSHSLEPEDRYSFSNGLHK